MSSITKETSHKSSTAARLAISSGPVATSAEARKNRKKKTSDHHENLDDMIILPPTISNNLISVPVPVEAVLPPTALESHPLQPSPSPPPLPIPMDDLSPSPPATPTPRMSSAHPSEAPTDLSSLLAPDVPMNAPPTSLPVRDLASDVFTQPPRPLTISRSEGNIAIPATNAYMSSIRARVEESAARRRLESNGPSRNPLEKYTKVILPTTRVHDPFPTALYDNIDFQLLSDWESCEGEKVLIHTFDNIAVDIQDHATVRNTILSAVEDITQADHISVSAPVPIGKPIPTTFLVYGLTPTQQKTLLDRYVWSSASITFRVMPTDLLCPDFLFSIKQLGTNVTNYVQEIVRAVWNDEDTFTFLSGITDTVPLTERRQMTTALQSFIDSLRVEHLDIKVSGGAASPHFNIFAKGSTIRNDSTWSEIRAFLANRSYGNNLIGYGITKTSPYKCTLCHGVDHPRGLCPFPSTQGWNGPVQQSNNRGDRGRA